jgi:triacylglycerol lipase
MSQPNWRSIKFEYSKLSFLFEASAAAYENLASIRAAVEVALDIPASNVTPFQSLPNSALEDIPASRRRCVSIMDTQGFIAGDKDKIVLAFRGTESSRNGRFFAKDWGTDALFQQARFNNYFTDSEDIGAIHAGFGKAVHDVWSRKPRVPSILRTYRSRFPNASLWITGHSLGGALAIVSAAACCFDGERQSPVAGVYTFGQPRVGDAFFRSQFEAAIGRRTFFVVNDGDLVTRVPPRSFRCIPGLSYAVTGRILFLEKNAPSNDPTAWHRFLETEKVGWENALKLPSSIKDHALENYRRKIEAHRNDIENLEW